QQIDLAALQRSHQQPEQLERVAGQGREARRECRPDDRDPQQRGSPLLGRFLLGLGLLLPESARRRLLSPGVRRHHAQGETEDRARADHVPSLVLPASEVFMLESTLRRVLIGTIRRILYGSWGEYLARVPLGG